MAVRLHPNDDHLSVFERLKLRARAQARAAKRSGLLAPEPCRDCGNSKAEMHHPNYYRPLDVVWLCVVCHKAVHREKTARP